MVYIYSKKNDHSQKDQNLVFKTNYCLMQVKSIAECSKGSILQYFRPSLSYIFFIKIFALSIFEWPFTKCFTAVLKCYNHLNCVQKLGVFRFFFAKSQNSPSPNI